MSFSPTTAAARSLWLRNPSARADDFRHRFSTQVFEAADDSALPALYDYGYRHYAPQHGRWLSRDPIGEEGGLLLYGFCGNGPLGAVDALGLQDWAYYAEEQVQRDVENAVAARKAAEALYAECYDPDDQNGDGLPDLTYTSGTSGGTRRSRVAPAVVVRGWIKNAWRRLRGGQETCETAVGSNGGQGGQDNCGTPVKPGD